VSILLDKYTGRFDGVEGLEKLPQNPFVHNREIVDLYRECYADLCSVVLLDFRLLTDYLEAFIYDTQILHILEEDDMYLLRLRMACIFNVRYLQELKPKMLNYMQQIKGEQGITDEMMLKASVLAIRAEVYNISINNGADGATAMNVAWNLCNSYREYMNDHDVYSSLEDYLTLCAESLEAALSRKDAHFSTWLRNFYRNNNTMKTIDIEDIMMYIHDDVR
jgi:hypothetical protein